MKVWAVTLDISTLNSTAFEAVRGSLARSSTGVLGLTQRFVSSITPGDYRLWMSPLERRSRNSFEGRTHSVGSTPFSLFVFRLIRCVTRRIARRQSATEVDAA